MRQLGIWTTACALVCSSYAHADTIAVDFEAPAYTAGSIDGQDGWAGSAGAAIDPAIDQEVSTSIALSGNQSLRISSFHTNSDFGSHPFTPSLTDAAGEPGAVGGTFAGGTRQDEFHAVVHFASATPSAQDSHVAISPDRGDGARMGVLTISDNVSDPKRCASGVNQGLSCANPGDCGADACVADGRTGLSVSFTDYKVPSDPADCIEVPDGEGKCFVFTVVATGLDRGVWHSVEIGIDFQDGKGNDVVTVSVDGNANFVGTSWEDYFLNEQPASFPLDPPSVDSLLLRASGSAEGNPGEGFFFDDIDYQSGPCVATGDSDQDGLCDDVDPCTSEGEDCDDGDPCTTGSTCSNNTCGGGTPAVCDDGNDCTDDTCAPGSGCTFTPRTGACDDGDSCTTGELCALGTCTGGLPVSCDDGNLCTDDSCDSQSGCVFTPNQAPCDDASVCTENDTCSGGTCSGGTPIPCDDQNVCTDDGCDPQGGCTFTANTAPCEDGDACTVGDTCSAEACGPGGPRDCDDANLCTNDSCDSVDGCLHAPASGTCDDGDACTENDACSAGDCTGTLAPECIPECGDANEDGTIRATDAYIALGTAVGALACPLSLCDANGNGVINTTDAFLILRVAVGQTTELNCESTSSSTTSTTAISTTTTLP